MPTSARRRLGARSALLSVAIVAGSVVVASSPAGALEYVKDRTLFDSRIKESSGLARSAYSRDTLFTHNDSGDSARVFAVGTSGTTQAVISLSGATARDWEDIAAGPNQSLWVADIGDNSRSRDSITVHRFVEPATLSNTTVSSTAYRFTYPDGRHDAEALMVHPVSGRVYVITKQSSGAGIYAAPSTLSVTNLNRLTRVATAPSLITAASFSPDGSRFVLGGYGSIYVYRSIGGTPVKMQKPSLKQGESAEISRSGGTVLVGSEGDDSPVYRMQLP